MYYGIVGKICSGKDTVCEILKSEGFEILKFSDILKEIIEILKIEETRENLQKMGNALSSNFGEDVLGKAIVNKAKGLDKVVINGIRRKNELEFLKSNGFGIIGLVCDDKLRFKRINERMRFGKKLTMDEFKKIEENPSELQITELINMSDIKINNDGSLESLRGILTQTLIK